MPHVRYIGPHDRIHVPALNLENHPKGELIDVDEGAAIALCRQPANWELVPDEELPVAPADEPPADDTVPPTGATTPTPAEQAAAAAQAAMNQNTEG